jgi:hypothetical protein
MHLCKNCQHAQIGTHIRCRHPNNVKISPLTGEPADRLMAETLREFDKVRGVETCGPEGSWFEPIKVQDIES